MNQKGIAKDGKKPNQLSKTFGIGALVESSLCGITHAFLTRFESIHVDKNPLAPQGLPELTYIGFIMRND